MRAKDFINELKIDNQNGWGQTPNNAEVDYMGLKVKMEPQMFLRLAAELPIDDKAQGKINAMKAHAQSGGSFGAPTLYIRVPDAWEQGDFSTREWPYVYGHEGRHRMNTERELSGGFYVETHIFLQSAHKEWKHRYGKNSAFTREIIDALQNGPIESEDGTVVPTKNKFLLY